VTDPLTALFCGVIIALLVVGAELSRRLLGVPERLTRMSVHMGSGALVALAPLFFTSRWWPAGVAAAALIVLTVCRWRGWLPAIHAARPASYGTSWFALATLILYLAAWNTPWLVTIPLLVMAFADTAGVLAGERVRVTNLPHGFRDKSREGAAAVFLVTWVAVALGWEAFGLSGAGSALLIRLACAPTGMVIEALSGRGSDNFTLPLGIAFTLVLVVETPDQPMMLLVTEFVAVLFALTAFHLRVLRADGAAGAFLLAVWLFGGGGWPWILPLLVFFIFSSLLTRLADGLRGERPALEQKGGRRDLAQVGANGGIALLIFAADLFGLPGYLSWPAFLGAVATATADTWATEIGTTLRAEARFITNFRRVPAGISGGVTLAGTLAGLTGAGVLALAGILMPPARDLAGTEVFVAVIGGGFIGMIADSYLGALWQGRWRCSVCAAVTERHRHCGEPVGERVEGVSWLDNDVVNLLAAVIGAGSAVLITTLF